jgi:plastocyanin
MRFYGLAVAASALVLGACGGGDNKGDDTSAAGGAATDTSAMGGAPAGGAAAGGAATGAAAAITGTTHTVNMVGDEKGYRYEPANITVKAGDGIKFVNVSGGPHNVAFDPANIPDDVEPQLAANMPEQMAPLTGKLLVTPNDAYTVSFANVKAGKYDYHCTPHIAMNMKGVITVQ